MPAEPAFHDGRPKVKMFLAKANSAAAVFDATAGSPAVRRAGPNCPYYQTKPDLTPSGRLLEAKDPAQLIAYLECSVLPSPKPASVIYRRGNTPVRYFKVTPHSQRSYAYIRFSLRDNSWPDLSAFILELEQGIGTPVQTAVKRSDEQAFAKLNGENLMFCEDAARRIKLSLEQADFVQNYWFKVEHQESLHAHNAVVIDSNYAGGESA